MPERIPVVLGPNGKPLRPSRARALAGGDGRWNGPAYDAASLVDPHTAAWTPYLWSPDAEINLYRDRIVSRTRDAVRNDGWASGVVTRILDNAIGAHLRPIPKPDYRLLAQATGIKGFDAEWAKVYGRAIDAYWRLWAVTDPGRYCDVARNSSFTQMMRTAFRHKLIDGDALAVIQWLPDRVGPGRARYSTCVALVDPDRLSNPQLRFDQNTLRGGVEIDPVHGNAIAYHIRRAHAGDWFNAIDSLTWDRIPRETSFGRPIVVHDYDGDRASTHRGGAGIFAPILQRMRMLAKYDQVELDSAIVNSIFSAYIESPFDHELVGDALDDDEHLNFYQTTRKEFHDGSNDIKLGNARIPILFPGEEIKSVTANRPSNNFKFFESAVLKNVASSVGLSAQQVSNDWSDVNYSSARGALLEAWKTLSRRRHDFAEGFAVPIRGAFLEECHEVEDLPLPAGAPAFGEYRGAYMAARWIGPPIGWIDPMAEAQASVMRMDGGFDCLEDVCASQGSDWEEMVEQRAFEVAKFKELGLPLPEWSGIIPQTKAGPETAKETVKKPEPV